MSGSEENSLLILSNAAATAFFHEYTLNMAIASASLASFSNCPSRDGEQSVFTKSEQTAARLSY